MMTAYERMVENQYFIKGIESRVTGIEKRQAQGVRIDPTYICVAESEIDFVWPMGFDWDHIKLEALRTRLNKIREYELSCPKPKLPLYAPIIG